MMVKLIPELLLGAPFRKARLHAAFLLFCAILIAGSIPNARAEIGHFASGVVLHSVAYSSITFLLWSGLQHGRAGNAVRAFLLVAGMGALDELVQSFFPYRSASLIDWAVDCGASFLTAWFCWQFVFNFLPSARRSAQ